MELWNVLSSHYSQQWAMAMMFSAQFTDKYKGHLWTEAVNTTTMLTNQAINSVNQDSPNDLFFGNTLPKLHRPYKDLKELGRIRHITIRAKVRKLDEKTIKFGMFDGPLLWYVPHVHPRDKLGY